MLSVFRRLLGQSTADRLRATASVKKLQSLRYRYSPELIANLCGQHQELLRLLADLEYACERADASACRPALDRFAAALQNHLTFENRHLYGYFSRHEHADREVARRIETMATDMMHVGRILHRFLRSYSQKVLEPSLLAQFQRDLRAVGEVLVHRIHEEETVLYPLYAPPAA